jgi:hypothetical protein
MTQGCDALGEGFDRRLRDLQEINRNVSDVNKIKTPRIDIMRNVVYFDNLVGFPANPEISSSRNSRSKCGRKFHCHLKFSGFSRSSSPCSE